MCGEGGGIAMGGYGSGYKWAAKATVESCLILSAARLQSLGILRPDSNATTEITWSNRDGEDIAGGKWEIDVRTARDPSDWHISIIAPGHPWGLHMVHLTTTPLPWRGVRWWFLCPMRYPVGRKWIDETGMTRQVHADCDRRAGKLYLRPGTGVFGCRRCHDLTYRSCQESHKHDKFFAELARDMGVSPRDAKRLWRA